MDVKLVFLVGALIALMAGIYILNPVKPAGQNIVNDTNSKSPTINTPSESPLAQQTQPLSSPVISPEGLVIQDLTLGNGAEAKTGNTITVHYAGTLENGSKFDSSYGGQPFSFKLGEGTVIRGWDEGLVGMKVGGKRKLTIPPSLGYGERGFPPAIPSNSTLVFEVELLEAR